MANLIPSPDIDPVTRRRLPGYLTGLPTLADWHQHAACTGVDTELFFPATRGQAEHARTICASCPVTEPCRAHAETMPEAYGVWGGTTPRERGWNYEPVAHS
ncbi:WhiB family transcriptional regulator [Streptomyces sp. NPDC057909]|uniref:WhiB family transcriptional regulator n=1 Tax=Streptomyces sp. NPDC057909 TaxID=3346277 RepID=UPI0036EDC7C8